MPTTVNVTPGTAELAALGATVRLSAEVRDQAGGAMPGAAVSWASGDAAVATVDASGLVTAVANGTAPVTATAGSASGTATVTVAQAVDSVAVSPAEATLAPGDTVRLSAEALDANGHQVAGAEFSWSSSDESVATVDGSGLVTGAAAGAADIAAATGGVTGRAALSVRAPLSDREILEILYDATGGPNWTNNDGWLTDAPLREWHGVGTDGQSRVVKLQFLSNNLSGRIPPELGDLASLTTLHFWANNLSGPIPPELGNLPDLRVLQLGGNRSLTGRIPPEIGNLTSLRGLSLVSTNLTGTIPPEIGNLTSLTWLTLLDNDFIGGIPPEIGNLANLSALDLISNRFVGPIPPELGDLINLTRLNLGHNRLAGPVPPELGRLANLRTLSLEGNNLSGPILGEIGNLANLTELKLGRNSLSGPIPPQLGGLASLRELSLSDNELVGPIPPEFGNLAQLARLEVHENSLAGSIPPELGRLSGVQVLSMNENELTGPIPAELGELSTLEQLFLHNNDLSGTLLPELGGLSSLRELVLSNNRRMAGPLPTALAGLLELEAFHAGGTGLCAPADPGLQDWLAGIRERWIAPCAEGDPPPAYLVQTVQSRELPVPLVAGERALLRVFPTAARSTSAGIPPVRARFHVDGREVHMADIPGTSEPIPTEVDEGSLAGSANAEIPADVVQPGLEMVVDIDPEGTLDPSLGVTRRIPETGRLPVDVRELPLFRLTLVPFLWDAAPDSSILAITDGLTEDDDLFWMTRTLLPVGDFDLVIHEPVVASTNDVPQLKAMTEAIWVMEGRRGYYQGTVAGPFTGPRGFGSTITQVSFAVLGTPISSDMQYVSAHEIGHTMRLLHPQCGGAGDPDRFYPHAAGAIGAWGYDFENGGSLVAPDNPDLMSYCGDGRWWISDYHFTKAIRFRLSGESPAAAPADAASATSLLLWGGVDSEGELRLEPTFVIDAPAALPDSTGEYAVIGRGATGAELFSLRFAVPEVADGDGSSSFAFSLPIRPEWEGDLASITLTGPGGSFTLDGESDRPMAILRDPRTGQVRGFLRDLPPATLTRADAVAAVSPEPGLEVLFSRGIPGAEAWRR